ncbi:hypothetical protein F4703DRAFT_1926886 [Phycomyces blakesleeanus]
MQNNIDPRVSISEKRKMASNSAGNDFSITPGKSSAESRELPQTHVNYFPASKTNRAGEKRERHLEDQNDRNESNKKRSNPLPITERLKGQSASQKSLLNGSQKNNTPSDHQVGKDKNNDRRLPTSRISSPQTRTSSNSNTLTAKEREALKVDARMFIRQLPIDPSKRDLIVFFEKYGKVLDVSLKGNYGFVQFDSPEACRSAVRAENGRHFKGITLENCTSLQPCTSKLSALFTSRPQSTNNEPICSTHILCLLLTGLEVCRHKPSGKDAEKVVPNRHNSHHGGRSPSSERRKRSPSKSPPPKRRENLHSGQNRDHQDNSSRNNSTGKRRAEKNTTEDTYEDATSYSKSDTYNSKVRRIEDLYPPASPKYDVHSNPYITTQYRPETFGFGVRTVGQSRFPEEYKPSVRRELTSSGFVTVRSEPFPENYPPVQNGMPFQDRSQNEYRLQHLQLNNFPLRMPPLPSPTTERNELRQTPNNTSQTHSPRRATSPLAGNQATPYPNDFESNTPLVQAIVWGDVNHNFVEYIHIAFKAQGIPIQTRFLQYGVVSRDIVIKQMIMEGARAVLIVEPDQEIQGKVYLQVFEQSGSTDTNSVRFDEYDSITVKDAIIILHRALQNSPSHSPLPVVPQAYNRSKQPATLPTAVDKLPVSSLQPNHLGFGGIPHLPQFAHPSVVNNPEPIPGIATGNVNALAAFLTLMQNAAAQTPAAAAPPSATAPDALQQLLAAFGGASAPASALPSSSTQPSIWASALGLLAQQQPQLNNIMGAANLFNGTNAQLLQSMMAAASNPTQNIPTSSHYESSQQNYPNPKQSSLSMPHNGNAMLERDEMISRLQMLSQSVQQSHRAQDSTPKKETNNKRV